MSQLIQSLLDNGINFLLAILLYGFATYLDPKNPFLIRRSRFVYHLCCYVSIFYLLLIPTQIAASWQIFSLERQQDVLQFDSASRRIAKFAADIKSAQTYDQVSMALRVHQSISLGNNDRQMPLNKIKNILLKRASNAQEILASKRNPDLLSGKAFIQIQILLRNTIVSIGYAIAFAGLAQRPQSNGPMLQEIFAAVMNFLEGNLQRRQEKLLLEKEQQNSELNHDIFPQLDEATMYRLQNQGLIDRGWLESQENGDHTSLHKEVGSSPARDTILSRMLRFLSQLFRLRGADSTPRFDHNLSELVGQSVPHANDSSVPVNESTNSNSGVQKAFESGTQQSRSTRSQRSRIADFDYFDSLAQDQLKSESEDHQDPPSQR